MKHQTISFYKSAIRIVGYIGLASYVHVLAWPVLILVGSELIGVVEELGHE